MDSSGDSRSQQGITVEANGPGPDASVGIRSAISRGGRPAFCRRHLAA